MKNIKQKILNIIDKLFNRKNKYMNTPKEFPGVEHFREYLNRPNQTEPKIHYSAKGVHSGRILKDIN